MPCLCKMSAPKMKYGRAYRKCDVTLDEETYNALLTIQDSLRRESARPTTPVSKATAVRSAIRVYAKSLTKLSGTGRLKEETARAMEHTYARK